MIIFDLKCTPQGHVFEAWFGSSADYEEQRARGLVACPICGAPDVDKAPMAPHVGPKGRGSDGPGAPEAGVKELLAQMGALQRRILKDSEHVGDRFPEEARAIHLGEAEARAIHGRASRAEAQSLIAEGIEVAPLPFPVPLPGEEN